MQLGMVLPGDTGPSAVLHVNESVQVHAEGEVRALFIGGVPMYRYVATDRAGVSYARVLLLTSGLATVTELASAFDCARLSIYRERERFEAEGIEGLVQKKRGPKGPSKLRGASQRRVVALRREGVPKLQIAQKLGVSEGTIRNVCKRLGLDEDKPSVASLQLPLSAPEVAEGDAQRAPANSKSVDVPGKAAPADEAVASQESSATPEAFEGAEAVSPEASSSSSPAEAEVSVSPGDSQPDTSDVPPLMGIHGRPESWNRDGDRALAALGLLVEAPPQFGPARQVRGAGALLAIPLLLSSGMLDAAREVYRSFGRAFYGVPTLFLAMALMALLRVRRPEWLRHRSPLDLGRLLGLDRAPEVKTLRRRIGVLAERGKSEEFLDKLARRRAESVGEALGFLYVDGHVRAYNGKHELPKAHLTRLRLSMPATVDHWVNDGNGDPLFVVTATPTASTAHELPEVLKKVRAVVGARRTTVVFDRGGWSPKLFASMVEQGFDFATYRKGHIPKARSSRFVEHRGTFDGREVSYQLVERALRLSSGLKVREVVRLSENGKHQTSIVTSRIDLPAVEVAYRMFERWRQENFFKYMGEEFELDSLVQYGVEEADAKREVPNPKRRIKEREIAAVRTEVAALERTFGAALADNEEARRPTVRGFKIANGETGRALREARDRLALLRAEAKNIPRRVTASEAAEGRPVVRLRTEAKRLTDAIKMVAYQAESSLVRMVRPHYVRADDEGRKLIASALELAGDFDVVGSELHITLEPAASPNRTKAIAALCAEVNASNTCYPGTSLSLRFTIREA